MMKAQDVLTVLDIGARGGPDPRWIPLGSSVRIVGIEADPDECARLNQRRFPVECLYLQAALGRADGTEATLHITKQPGCSSLLKPNDEFLRDFPYGDAFTVERTVSLPLTSLDTLCRANDVHPDVIKIDTQGYELEILAGGEDAVASAFLIELEVEFNPLYRDQPLFGDLDAHLRARGFSLLGLRRTAWRRNYDGSSSLGGTVVHGDVLYYREPSREDTTARRRFARALGAYRQLDFVQAMGGQVASQSQPNFFQRQLGRVLAVFRTHRRLRAWLDYGRPSGARDWHDPDFF
jgi:FkbM family methyltransferase